MSIPPIPQLVLMATLLFLSFVDLFTYKNKKGIIPSIITSGLLVALIFLNGFESLGGLIVGSLMAWLLWDADVMKGMADVKLFIACCMLIPTNLLIGYFTLIMVGLYIFFLIIWVVIMKKKEYPPFIPVIFFSYATYLVIWGVLN